MVVTTATFGIALFIMGVVNLLGILRVERKGELRGLDLYEHGISAYPEYVIATWALPSEEDVSIAPRPSVPTTSTPAQAVGKKVSSGSH